MLVFPSNPNAGDIFGQWRWDGEKWTRNAGGLQLALEALTDVAVTDPTQGEMLRWDADAEKWINTAVPVVDLSAYATKQFVSDQIAAIPPPAVPSLASLTDTSLANLAAGQALTWSGAQWVNANIFTSPVTCQDPFGGPIWETLPTAGTAAFQVYASQNASGISIAQNAANSSFGADWLLKVVGNTASPAGMSYGMYMRAGNSVGAGGNDTAIQVTNIQGETIFKLDGQGSMTLGAPYDTSTGWIRAPMTIDWMGNMTLGQASPQPTNPHRCVINARDNQTALVTNSSGATWVAIIANTNTGGTSYGLNVQAGLSANDWAMQVVRRAGGLLLGVRGDGNINVPNTQQTATGDNISADGWMTRRTSLRAVKANIRSVSRQRARDVVQKLHAIQFHSLCKGDDPTRDCYGLIAEEVAAIEPNLATYDAEGNLAGVSYDRIALLLLPLMQELLEKQPC